jgi:hypothetical protein
MDQCAPLESTSAFLSSMVLASRAPLTRRANLIADWANERGSSRYTSSTSILSRTMAAYFLLRALNSHHYWKRLHSPSETSCLGQRLASGVQPSSKPARKHIPQALFTLTAMRIYNPCLMMCTNIPHATTSRPSPWNLHKACLGLASTLIHPYTIRFPPWNKLHLPTRRHPYLRISP